VQMPAQRGRSCLRLWLHARSDVMCVSTSPISPQDMLNVQIIQQPCPPTNPPQSPLSGGSLSCRAL
ncbi:hypothetical protein KUCAC02_026355, partial [Chaenocephalus aceratus]